MMKTTIFKINNISVASTLLTITVAVFIIQGCKNGPKPKIPGADKFLQNAVEATVVFSCGEPNEDTVVGSGVIVDPAGVVLTNMHVLGPVMKEECSVYLNEETPLYIAGVYSFDLEEDWAFFRVSDREKKAEGEFPYLTMADSRKIKQGQRCWNVGNPGGLIKTLTEGVISHPSRKVKEYPAVVIQHSAAIGPGSSGGPLLDEHGRLIGINVATKSVLTLFGLGGFAQNLNFAIPTHLLKVPGLQEKVIPPEAFSRFCTALADKEVDFNYKACVEDAMLALDTKGAGEFVEAMVLAAECSMLADRCGDGIELFKNALKIRIDDPDLMYRLGEAYLCDQGAESLDEARKIYDKLKTLHPARAEDLMRKINIVSQSPSEINPDKLFEGGSETTTPDYGSGEVDESSLSPIEKIIYDRFGKDGLVVYGLIDGKRTAEEIMKEANITAKQIIEILDFMDEEGIVKLEYPSSAGYDVQKEGAKQEENEKDWKESERQKKIADGLYELYIFYLKQNNVEKAAPIIEEVLQWEKEPDYMMIHYLNLSICYHMLAKLDKALSLVNKSIELQLQLDIDSYETYSNRGGTELLLGLYSAALADFSKAAAELEAEKGMDEEKLRKARADLKTGEVMALHKLGKKEEALKAAEELLMLEPKWCDGMVMYDEEGWFISKKMMQLMKLVYKNVISKAAAGCE